MVNTRPTRELVTIPLPWISLLIFTLVAIEAAAEWTTAALPTGMNTTTLTQPAGKHAKINVDFTGKNRAWKIESRKGYDIYIALSAGGKGEGKEADLTDCGAFDLDMYDNIDETLSSPSGRVRKLCEVMFADGRRTLPLKSPAVIHSNLSGKDAVVAASVTFTLSDPCVPWPPEVGGYRPPTPRMPTLWLENEDMVISSPNYGKGSVAPSQECRWWVQAPPGMAIQLTFFDVSMSSMDVEDPEPRQSLRCDDTLKIQDGPRMTCPNIWEGCSINRSEPLVVHTTGRTALLEHKVWYLGEPDPDADYGRGFKARVEYVKLTSVCKTTDPGNEYSGSVRVTASGRECAPWDLQADNGTTHNRRELREDSFPEGSVEKAENFCRNPSDVHYSTEGYDFYDPSGPWCYIHDPLERTERCCIPKCIGNTVASCGWIPEQPAPITNPVRLFGRDSDTEGYLEMLHNGQWAYVCAWYTYDGEVMARVICRQLGLSGGKIVDTRAIYGYSKREGQLNLKDRVAWTSNANIWSNANILCLGAEPALEYCEHRPWMLDVCRGDEGKPREWDHLFIQCDRSSLTAPCSGLMLILLAITGLNK